MVAEIQEQYSNLPIDQVIHGDALAVLKTFPSNSIQAIVCDPPCGINFMNLKFDSDRGGRDKWIAWLTDIMKEAIRVLAPGGFALVWALPRTSHWTATALENAGFQVRDELSHHFATDTLAYNFIASLDAEQVQCLEQILEGQSPSILQFLFGSGFPKSMAIDKAIDAHLGKSAEREVIGEKVYADGTKAHISNKEHEGWQRPWKHDVEAVKRHDSITAPATDAARRYSGYGSALKPSHENWLLVRKPLSEKTLAENVLRWNGCGGLNIDKCRVGTQDNLNGGAYSPSPREDGKSTNKVYGEYNRLPQRYEQPSGRFPSNTLFSHSLFCVPKGVKRVRGNSPMGHNGNTTINDYGKYNHRSEITHGMEEEVQDYECDPSCPIYLLGEQSGVRKNGGHNHTSGNQQSMFGNTVVSPTQYAGDTGTAARYFQQLHPLDELRAPFLYTSKASRRERDAGLEHLPEHQGFDKNTSKQIAHINHTTGETTYNEYQPSARRNSHPTVKSLSLMRYLCRLVGVPGGVILDPFAGSGSTLVAAIQEGFSFIGIEQSEEYCAIANARIRHAMQEAGWETEVQEFDCHPSCPIKILGDQSGERKSGGRITQSYETPTLGATPFIRSKDFHMERSEGTAARFFTQLPPDSLFAELDEEDSA